MVVHSYCRNKNATENSDQLQESSRCWMLDKRIAHRGSPQITRMDTDPSHQRFDPHRTSSVARRRCTLGTVTRSPAILSACAIFLAVAGCGDLDSNSERPTVCDIRGIVSDTAENPIPDAEVHLLWSKSRYKSVHSETAVNLAGEFQLEVPFDQALRLWITAPNHQHIEVPVLITDEIKAGSLRVVLPEVDDDGEPKTEWSTDLVFLAEMALIRRLANAESAEAMRTLYEISGPEFLPHLGDADPILENVDSLDLRVQYPEGTIDFAVRHPTAQAFAMVQGLAAGGRSVSLNGVSEFSPTEILNAVPPSSPVWGFASDSLLRTIVAEHDPRDDPSSAAARFKTAYESNPDRLVQGVALAHLVFCATRSGELDIASELFDQLESQYGDMVELGPLLQAFDPDTHVRTGVTAPDFSVKLTDGTVCSKADLIGRWTLMDIWSIRCGPCIGDMPQLHLANELFAPRGLKILSISIDREPTRIAEFRARTFPMPWLHAIPPEGDFDENVKILNPANVTPWLFLVSPEGMIVATSEDLRRERLIPTLSRFLGMPETEPTAD